MDSDQFYDSLDEETTISGATIESRKKLSLKPVEQIDIDTLVPLYEKETRKQDIKRPNKMKKRPVKNTPFPKSESNLAARKQKAVEKELKSVRTESKSSIFSNNSLSSVLEGKRKKTYLELFHKKIGFVQGGPGNDTTRGLKGGDTFRSAVSSQSGGSEFSDAVSFVSDSTSFYINFMDEDKLKKKEETANTLSDGVSNLSLNESKFNLKSVSQYSLKSNNVKCGVRKSRFSFKIKFNNSTVEVPTLGRLGPDSEAIKLKMQKLKRQQSYGQKVSNDNRLRMLELQVIKNFNQEMKKSSDINKSAKNIIIM